MTEEFLTFRQFNDAETAKELIVVLNENSIETLLEDNSAVFDPSFANNILEKDFRIKIKQKDFIKANVALERVYQSQLEIIDKDYYLFSFTNDELEEIIFKPDEWGELDYQLSQKILKERGREINKQQLSQIKNSRIKELAQPGKLSLGAFAFGLFLSLILGIPGIVFGWYVSNFKKTLPDGQRIFIYDENSRQKGNWIFIVGIISFMCWLLLRLTGIISWFWYRA